MDFETNRWTQKLALGILAVGVLSRLASYLGNRSLWLDEAMLALNIERRSYSELLGTLDFNQAAPLGFLWLEKSAVTLLGVNELALRLWPLIAGVAALFVFHALTARLLDGSGRLIALALFAISAALVYFSSEVKQYSFDVAAASLLILTALRYRDGDRIETRGWVALGLAGVVGVWFSHPLVFVLPGVLAYVWTADRATRTRPLAVVGVLWGVSFAAAFWLTARGASQNPAMSQFWLEGFMPLVPTTLADLTWYPDALTGWIRTALDFSDTVSPLRTAAIWIGLILALVGAVVGWRQERRAFFLIAMPVALALLASALRIYPFKGRLILFLTPSTLILIGWGAQSLARRGRLFATPGIAVLLATMAILIGWLRTPYREELRPVLVEVAERVRPGDHVYLHSGALHAALFYERICDACRFEGANVLRGGLLFGRDESIESELSRLPTAGRLWAIFSHEWWGAGALERDRLVAELERRAGPPELISAPGAEAYLFQTSDPRLDALAAAGLGGRLAQLNELSVELADEAWAAGRVEDAHWYALRPAYALLYGPREADAALQLAEATLERFPPDPSSPHSALVLADFFVRAGQHDRARALTDVWLRTRAIERPHGGLERVEALLRLGVGDLSGAIQRLQSADVRADGCTACADFDLAVAYEAGGMADSAIAAFGRAFRNSDGRPRTPAAHAAPYALRRLGALNAARVTEPGPAQSTSRTEAREAWQRFLDLWSEADAPFLRERARIEAELARLSASGG